MEELNEEQRRTFYECLAHNLTIAVRDVWSSDQMPTDKVEQLKWLNEIQHRVTVTIMVLRTHDQEWSERDSWNEHWTAQDKRNSRSPGDWCCPANSKTEILISIP
jgi:hypothetical protein